jgi:hypothetical protein
MKLILLFLILFFSVNLKAQVEKYHIGLKQSPLSDSLMNSAYIKAKPRQFRSVYRLKWEGNSKVKVVSKPKIIHIKSSLNLEMKRLCTTVSILLLMES